MTVVTGLMALGEGKMRSGYLLTSTAPPGSASSHDPIVQLKVPLNRSLWTGIVIHHLGEPTGDARSVHRAHLSYGYQGLGYHFLIGNGSGLGDGVVHVGYRWNEQLPGVHTTGPRADEFNQRAIGICLIGNGDRRPFTDKQVAQLVSLVRRLQRELGLPAEAVRLHREVAPGRTSPGRFFAAAELREQLLN